MKKILHYLKNIISLLLKVIVAVMMGLITSLGNKSIKVEKEDNKTISTNK